MMMMMLNPLQKTFSYAKTLVFSPLNPPTKTTSPFVVSSSKQGNPPPVTKHNPRPRRRGRKSEAEAVEDFVRTTLERAISAVRDADPESIPTGRILKGGMEVDTGPNSDDDEEVDGEGGEAAGGRKGRKFVVEEESEDWPVDTDVGWGIRSSEYFEKHPIRNVVGDDGEVIDWEGEVEDGWVKEINCLEWEGFAFHPSPLVVLVFERFARASDNWKALKELENAIKVYWSSKDRLPPRAVKVDINIERDLAYALKVKEGPQILFLRGNRILYREKEIRTADELIQMIAHFYYKARKPSFITGKT